jgi:hypothetical protein
MLTSYRALGKMLGSEKLPLPRDEQDSFRMIPEAARARISALKADAGWARRYLNGDADARAEMTRLQEAGSQW